MATNLTGARVSLSIGKRLRKQTNGPKTPTVLSQSFLKKQESHHFEFGVALLGGLGEHGGLD
jgi:hypothetical protein